MSEHIKVITIWQPWASLIAHGHKKFETRSWKTSWSGEILIHAAKKWDIGQQQFYEAYCRKLLGKDEPLPKGRIVAKANLVECVPTESIVGELSSQELLFGDYSGNRYAWKLDNVEPLGFPIRWKGLQGMWQIDYEKFMAQVNFGEMEW